MDPLPLSGDFTFTLRLVARVLRVEIDERGLLPLAVAEDCARGAGVFEWGSEHHLSDLEVSIFDLDVLWCSLMSLEPGDFLLTARRWKWRAQPRGTSNTDALQRFGDQTALDWVEEHIDDGKLWNVPWCLLPILLASATPRALELATAINSVESRLDSRLPPSAVEQVYIDYFWTTAWWLASHPDVAASLGSGRADPGWATVSGWLRPEDAGSFIAALRAHRFSARRAEAIARAFWGGRAGTV